MILNFYTYCKNSLIELESSLDIIQHNYAILCNFGIFSMQFSKKKQHCKKTNQTCFQSIHCKEIMDKKKICDLDK